MNNAGTNFKILEKQQTGENGLKMLLSGSLDADSAPVLSGELGAFLDESGRYVELDFSHVSFISSTGIGSLIAAIGEYREVDGDLVLTGLSAELHEVFEMMDLLDYVTVR